MTVEEFLASACNRKNLNPMEHFVRVKKRRDMEDHNYFVPHRTDLIETYVSYAIRRELFRRYEKIILEIKRFPRRCFSCIRTRSLRSAQRSCIRWNCKETLWNKCGASPWRPNSSKILIDRTSFAATLAESKIKVWPCRTVSLDLISRRT